MMVLADWIAIGLIALFAVVGILVGFGKGIRFITSGVIGVIISLVVCYFLFGVILDFPFVQDLIAKLNGAIRGDGTNQTLVFLVDTMQISYIIYGAGLFVIVQVLRVVVVALLHRIMEVNNGVMRFFNGFFGMILFVGVLVVLALIVLQIIAWVGGSTAEMFEQQISGGLFVNWIYQNNPVNAMFESFR